MQAATHTALLSGRRALALSALAGAFLVLILGLAADQALAAYTARVDEGTLRITGDSASDRLLLVNAADTLVVDVGADGTVDFSFDRNTFTAIEVRARGGDDEVFVQGVYDELLTVYGGGGSDTLRGGIGPDTLVGGGGNDVVDGNQGTDVALLGSGDDTFQWDPGDSSDTVEGQGGQDSLDFNGSNVGESIDVSANGPRLRFFRNIANIVLDADGVETVGFDAFGGADTIVVNQLVGTAVKTVDVDLNLFGGGGDSQPDTVIAVGTEGPDTAVIGSGSGEILVAGLGAGVQVSGGEEANDNVNVAMLGGEDTLLMGTGSTAGPATVNVDGGDAQDTVRYSGTGGDDTINVVANGAEAAVVGAGTARLDAIAESIVLLGLDGADTITAVGNLAPLTTLTYEGGAGPDTLLGGNGPDQLLGGAGDDHVDGNQGQDLALLGTGHDRFQWDPGDGNDVVEGEGGNDALDFNGSAIGEIMELSADGPRTRFTRNIANIVMDLGGVELVHPRVLGGDDTVVVNDLAGTGVQSVDVDLNAFGGGGDAAPDTVIANGTSGPDVVTIGSGTGEILVSGLAAHVQVVGGEAANDNVNVAMLGGDDVLKMGIGSTAGPATVNVDGGDAFDTARYSGTGADDTINVVANGAEASVVGPGTARLDAIAESLVLLGLDGADTMTAVGNLAALTTLTYEGGLGADTLLGSNGADQLIGGAGDDFVDGNQGEDTGLLGGGNDRFQWDPGDGSDVVEGQAGSDALDFNGSNIGELMEVSANGARVLFTRNIANIAMDLAGVEELNVRALGGTDTITVNDLSGTGLGSANIDLGAFGGGGDAQADTVITNGTERRDFVDVTRSGSQVLVAGLSVLTKIVGSEAANDTLRVQTLAGNDEVTVAPDVIDLITTVVDLGADD